MDSRIKMYSMSLKLHVAIIDYIVVNYVAGVILIDSRIKMYSRSLELHVAIFCYGVAGLISMDSRIEENTQI